MKASVDIPRVPDGYEPVRVCQLAAADIDELVTWGSCVDAIEAGAADCDDNELVIVVQRIEEPKRGYMRDDPGAENLLIEQVRERKGDL